MRHFLWTCIYLVIALAFSAEALSCQILASWESLKPILLSRLNQHNPKMKLKPEQVEELCHYLSYMDLPTPELIQLKTILPKTTVELLMSVYARGVKLEEAETMAQYLYFLTNAFQFENPSAFDENTSHIIGRDWHEIDYSGEGMTWKKQQALYKPYGIINFKSVEYLKKFFPIESKLPYFKKNYRPKNIDVFKKQE